MMKDSIVDLIYSQQIINHYLCCEQITNAINFKQDEHFATVLSDYVSDVRKRQGIAAPPPAPATPAAVSVNKNTCLSVCMCI
jgi:hypothetical protein